MAKTNAEAQADYRRRMKEAGFTAHLVWAPKGEKVSSVRWPVPRTPAKPQSGVIDATEAAKDPAVRAAVLKSIKADWLEEEKAKRLKTVKAEARRIERKKDMAFAEGEVAGICRAAEFFVSARVSRVDIAQNLLARFHIDREKAAVVLENDRRVKNMTLTRLDEAGAWKTPLSITRD